MRTIHKFPLEIKHLQTISMPKGAKILCVKIQNFTCQFWAEVETEITQFEDRQIMIVGTGKSINAIAYKYIESVIDGMYVWHFFEVL